MVKINSFLVFPVKLTLPHPSNSFLGNPVSSMATFLLFCIPCLRKMCGVKNPHLPVVQAKVHFCDVVVDVDVADAVGSGIGVGACVGVGVAVEVYSSIGAR